MSRSEPSVSVPQPRTYPLVGNAPSIDIDKPIQSMMQLARELGPVYRLAFPSQSVLVVGEHTLVHELCDDARFEKKVHAPLRELRDLGGDALFTAENDEPAWAIAHRLLSPRSARWRCAGTGPIWSTSAISLSRSGSGSGQMSSTTSRTT